MYWIKEKKKMRTIEIKPISVEYIDHMGDDKRVANVARVSFAKWDEEEFNEKDANLLAYLATGLPSAERNNWEALAKAHTHWTPFAHCFLSVRVSVPIFLARQLHKHTVGLVINECFSEDTEVLTEGGWKLWPDVTADDKLATPSKRGGTYHFEKPLSLFEQDYQGNMLHVFSRDIDMLVTPNHDQFVSSYSSKGWSEYEKVTTSECRAKQFPKTLPLPSIEADEGDDYHEGCLYGAFIGDGCASDDGLRIYFHVKKDRKKKFFRDLMEKTPEFDWTETQQPDGYSYFRIYNKGGWSGKLSNKDISFYKTTKSFYKGLLEGLISTDGCRQKNGGVSYSTTSFPLRKSLEKLAYLLGFDLKVHVSIREGWSTAYKILLKKNASKLLKNFQEVGYDGKVYCAKTSTGLLVVRRNGKSCVSGNCSRRYIKDDVSIYIPDVFHKAPDHAKQGASEEAHDALNWEYEDGNGRVRKCSTRDVVEIASKDAVVTYYSLLEAGVAPEEARMVLPLNAMTTWIWSGSLLGFNRVYQLRADRHSQNAAQEFAHKLGEILYEHFPESMKALNYGKES